MNSIYVLLLFQFTAQGLMITARNYLEVYIYDKWSGKVCSYCVISQKLAPVIRLFCVQ